MLEFLTLKSEVFGLDISDLSLKIAKLKKKRGVLSLASFGETTIPQGVIKEGEVLNIDSLASVLKEAVEKVHGEKLKTKYVIASLPEEKSFLQIIQLPKMSDKELETSVRFEAENYIPLPIEDMYLDFQVIQPFHGHLDHVDVLIAALPKAVVDPYVAAIKKAGLVPIALEVESQAISRALMKNNISPFSVLLIDLGATRTSFIVFSGYSVRFTSSISVSAYSFTESISKVMGINIEEAEKLKRRHGLDMSKKISFTKDNKETVFKKKIVQDKAIIDVLVPPIMDLIRQINKHIDYYQTHMGHEHFADQSSRLIKEVLLCGGGANLKGLVDVLSLELKMPVSTGNPWINILPQPLKEVPELSYNQSLSYATVLGLALRGLQSTDD